MSRFLDALAGRNKGRPPVWLMRQAGRYLPEYRALRARHSFLEMVHNPELIAEVTLLPFQRFAYDAAILFSDILVIPEAMDLGLRFEEGEGPIFARPVTPETPLTRSEGKLDYVSQGIRLLKPQLKVPLIGFAGAPFTVASYMIEGKSSRDFKKTKTWMVRDPASFHRLLDHLAEETIAYLNLQIDAGVDALQLFDSWAQHLDAYHMRHFAMPPIQKIIKGLKKPLPLILFSKNSSLFAEELAALQPAALGIDWNGDMAHIRKRVPHLALQGNLDPTLLYGNPRSHVERLLLSMQNDPAYIFNLGHGIHPDTPLENVQILMDTIMQSD